VRQRMRAFTDATLAIGLRYGTNRPSHKSREKAYAQTQKLYEQFTKTFGAPLCRELIDYDLTNPVELEKARKLRIFDKKCAEIVKKTVEMLLNLNM
jgi:C_GCAxxG_C_C family probable redox protein